MFLVCYKEISKCTKAKRCVKRLAFEEEVDSKTFFEDGGAQNIGRIKIYRTLIIKKKKNQKDNHH